MAPKLINLSKALANDKPALEKLTLDPTTASYKMKYGVAETFVQELTGELKSTPFSLNLDEAMNSNNEKVVTVLVSHFSSSQNKICVNHLGSFVCSKVTSENLFTELDSLFSRLDLPWSNLVSTMMDSCRVMRGEKAGLEALIRKRKSPQLLDVDGDTCHHAHNCAKAFAAPFERHLEKLLTDLHTDFKWSPHSRDLLASICTALEIPFSAPMQFIPHRWLSLLQVALNTQVLFDALLLYYFAFLPKSEQNIYRDIIEEKLANLQPKTKKGVAATQEKIRKMFSTGTNDGKERKMRIVEKLFKLQEKTLLVLSLFCSVLPILQKYITFFQKKEPLMHELHTKQEELIKDFLGCFVKPEYLAVTTKQLLKLDLSDESQVADNDIFIGTAAKKLLKTKSRSHCLKKEFYEQTRKGYYECGRMLLKKMPLQNPVLKSFSSLDPKLRGNSTMLSYMLKLKTHCDHFLDGEKEIDAFDQEARKFQWDSSLPEAVDPIDKWWGQVDSIKYPVLTKVAKICLSTFHGPLVESSFSIMATVIDKGTTRIGMETFSAIQTIKYALKVKESNSIDYFFKKDPVKEPVNGDLSRNMQNAWKKNEDRKELNKKISTNKIVELGLEPKKISTKKAATEEILAEATNARQNHRIMTTSSKTNEVGQSNSSSASKRKGDHQEMSPPSKSARTTDQGKPKKKKQSSLLGFVKPR